MENLGNLIKEFKAFINTTEGKEWTNECRRLLGERV